MHISEGVLSMPVLAGGAVLTVSGMLVGLKRINADNLPKTAVMAAAFFTASFIHVNVGPSSVHLMLNGLLGVMLGWAAFPVILVGLLIQGLLFQYGGLTTLGINTFNVAGPAVLFGIVFRGAILKDNIRQSSIAAFAAGFLSIAVTAVLVSLSLVLTDPVKYKVAAIAILTAHVPVMFIEALITLLCVRFIKKVRPELLVLSDSGPTRPPVD